MKLGILTNNYGKVVEGFSSSLDHARERKDTINANHMDMCRFSGIDDNGYRKITSVVSKCLESPTMISKQPPCKHIVTFNAV
jgi:hypothetical protein